jgi:hypothetical protein
MVCQRCGCPHLEYAASAARCTQCSALYAQSEGGWAPLIVQAPGGGENPEFNAIFEQKLGFGPRPMQQMPMHAAPPNPIARYMQIGIGCFVAAILCSVLAYVVLVLMRSMP